MSNPTEIHNIDQADVVMADASYNNVYAAEDYVNEDATTLRVAEEAVDLTTDTTTGRLPGWTRAGAAQLLAARLEAEDYKFGDHSEPASAA